MNTTWIALGSNLGDRAVTLARAVARLRDHGLHVQRTSHLYETSPEGMADEPLYLNGVLQARTGLEAEELLRLLQGVEAELGRAPEHRRGPRTCDLDLLALGDCVVERDPDLLLPHPRMHRRSFVLVPLCELDVHWRHPVLQRSAGDLLAALPLSEGQVRLHGPLPREA